ncbi:hypothetical protein BpJC7_30880 [Weizmannia acidilactici]|uniref:Uncharacterized protein n=1 Tax=Weizmannia acidilactici TaxID=2607726 RepID=A0A5J4JM76_9BACI|nr:hypothetical protein [Weizmannia acidilactici]GER67533.1 hypothetical protein BpJC4_20040 [Weizmannia acidilactici]GER71785.1 hypothetical protein BpJC7_30880 [Weizmannia acidilactici]GER75095.1 hypothetical protein BpPP18_31620 [Weizmannia acidilactici]
MYLTAYVLADRFNKLEEKYFSQPKKERNLKQLISEIDSLGILAFEDKNDK